MFLGLYLVLSLSIRRFDQILPYWGVVVILCTTDGLEVRRDGSSPALKVASLSLAVGGGSLRVISHWRWTPIIFPWDQPSSWRAWLDSNTGGFSISRTKSVLLLKYRFDQRSIKPGESWKPGRGRNCPGPDKPYEPRNRRELCVGRRNRTSYSFLFEFGDIKISWFEAL